MKRESKNKCALILAGGGGTRLWPLSTDDNPKQFIDVLGSGDSLLQASVRRLTNTIPPENIFISTRRDYLDMISAQCPDIPVNNLIAEPAKRDTAPAIGYGALAIAEHFEDFTLAVMPADHFIGDESAFNEALLQAFEEAEQAEVIVTIGIFPDGPRTEFGYIKLGGKAEKNIPLKVEEFVEKPDRETAERYLQSENYVWNAGMFILREQTLHSAYETLQPEMWESLKKFRREQDEEVFKNIEPVSMDYAIMEKHSDIRCIPARMNWSDVGSYKAIYQLSPKDPDGNVRPFENIHLEDCRDSLVINKTGKMLVARDLEDRVFVISEEGVLNISKEDSARIKEFL